MLMLEMICSDEVLLKDVGKAMRLKDSQTVAQRAQSSSFPCVSIANSPKRHIDEGLTPVRELLRFRAIFLSNLRMGGTGSTHLAMILLSSVPNSLTRG